MAKRQIHQPPKDPGKPECREPYIVLESAHESVAHLLSVFDEPRGEGRSRGAPPNVEQDVLRAMVLLAGAGLDSTLKQLVSTALPKLVWTDKAVAKAVHKYLEARMDAQPEVLPEDDGWPHGKYLLALLFKRSPRQTFMNDLTKRLAGRSLQSLRALEQTTDLFCLKLGDLGVSKEDIKDAIEVRNRIAHEMDVSFTRRAGQRHRRECRRETMVKHANALLDVAGAILVEAAGKL